jgi:hypothetical protein
MEQPGNPGCSCKIIPLLQRPNCLRIKSYYRKSYMVYTSNR